MTGTSDPVKEFARAVAHDLNNLLTVLAGYPELLLQRPGLDPEVKKRLETMLRASERATEYVAQLAALGGRMPQQPEEVDPLAVAREALGAEPDAEPVPPVRADRARLSRALSELVALVRERNPRLERVSLAVRRAAAAVEWSLADPTPLDEEARQRALLPFGLKRAERARGLALAVVAEWARAAGGSLEVLPAPPGVTWRLTLPV